MKTMEKKALCSWWIERSIEIFTEKNENKNNR